MMKVSIITSCTGRKTATTPNQLTQADFEKGASHLRSREAELAQWMRPAVALYSGEQHVRLMRGVHAAREQGAAVSVTILSAGYGLIPEEQLIAPYEMTFNGMKKKESHAWATMLGIRESIRAVLDADADLVLILLGERYLQACGFDAITPLRSPTWALCGTASAKQFSPAFQLVKLKQSDTSGYACGNIGLKGEVAARILENLHRGPDEAIRHVMALAA